MVDRIKELTISKNVSLKVALKRMDAIGRKLLIVLDDNEKFFSLLSIGDIQRAIIQNKDINTQIKNVLREEVRVANKSDDIEKIKAQMRIRRNEFMPIISSTGEITNIILWEDLFEHKRPQVGKSYNLPVIIMAGGVGKRLKPLTNVLPKPLIPIGEKTVIEMIMEKFHDLGCNNFHISLNYKADFIEYYINSLKKKYSIEFFREVKPLGTAGSLHLLKNKISETFFISNCDILIDEDYSEIIEYHNRNENELTIVAALKNFSLPYGVLKTGENSTLVAIEEKPDLTLKINTGLYILEPHLLKEIPNETFFNITELIQKVITRKGKIGVFPVSEGSWQDIGVWREYLKYIDDKE